MAQSDRVTRGAWRRCPSRPCRSAASRSLAPSHSISGSAWRPSSWAADLNNKNDPGLIRALGLNEVVSWILQIPLAPWLMLFQPLAWMIGWVVVLEGVMSL